MPRFNFDPVNNVRYISGLMALILPVILLVNRVQGQKQIKHRASTWASPIALNYQFSDNGLGYREAADPVIHLFKDEYYLYASKSGGYWYGPDLIHWHYRPSRTLPVKDYAPTVMAIGDTVFFMASAGAHHIYYNLNPKEDSWEIYNGAFPLSETDPALFLDDDGRVYFYYGCSDKDPLMGVELSRGRRLDTIGTPRVLIGHETALHGWERPGEDNTETRTGWNEGAWMTKYEGKYYLQYASPGTEFKTYADGVYLSDHPLGPFTYQHSSPFSGKTGGFIGGAGHGATFQDRYGNYWHVATMSISVRHMFERRIGLFPAFFDDQGHLYTNTAFGDYPMRQVTRKMDFEKESIFTGWMLLSYKKKVQASSFLPGHEPQLAVNEDVRSWWSAASGQPGQWLSVDLGRNSNVHALQLNFADQDAGLKDTDTAPPYRYKIEGSMDQKRWELIVDRSQNRQDLVTEYIELPSAKKLRFLKITAVQVPGGKFSIAGFRVFGLANGRLPAAVRDLSAERSATDGRTVRLSWDEVPEATGYLIRYGTSPDKRYQSVLLYDQHQLQLNSLNIGVPYYFSVDAFNESGVTKGTTVVSADIK